MNSLPALHLILLIINFTHSAKLPSNLKKCIYGDPNLGNCLARAVENEASLLTQPIKSIGLPNLEPLDIHSFSIGSGTGPVQVQENFENAVMYGLKDIQMQDATFNLEDMSMNYTGFLPKLKILGNYRLNGRVLLLPIVGRGNCTIILTNLTAVVHFPLEKIQKKGEIYIRITASKELKIPNLGRLYMHLENLFDGNKELGDTLNTVLNENWNSIWDDVRSGWEIFFAETVARIYNRFFAKVPLREMVDNLDPKFLA